MPREELVRVLYNSLPSPHPIKTGCAVTGIIESDNGIRVFMADGSYEDGDIVIGCDGVGSIVRDMMWQNTNQGMRKTIQDDELTGKLF